MSWLFEQSAAIASAHDMFLDMVPGIPRPVSLLEFAALDGRESESEGAALQDDSAEQEEQRQTQERAGTMAVMLEAARDAAREEMRRSLQASMESREAEQRTRVEHLVSEFARDRQRFFATAETQVVQLALAIARQVLAREIAQDPLHLAGTVRAALSKVQDEIGSVLRVSPDEAEAWRDLLQTPGGLQVQVVASDRLEPGECVLETQVGRIELSVPVQMTEIERGFEQVMPRQGR